MLDHLHIQYFKCFRDLRIEPLGRVNLITGKNNTGKTSLLEAIILRNFVWNPGQLGALRPIHQPDENGNHNAYWLDTYLSLFYRREPSSSFFINGRKYSLEGVDSNDFKQLSLGGSRATVQKATLKADPVDHIQYDFIASSSYDFEHLNHLWSRVALTPKEEEILKFLRSIEPRVLRVSMLEKFGPKQLYVLLDGDNEPTPISRLGEGVSRFLTLVTTLVNVEDGIMIVDEVDNGLHHSVQGHMWNYLFKYANAYNVQLFATTHSADCVEAFAAVGSQEAYRNDGRLIRLYRKNGEIGEVDFDIETVQAAVEGNIEMRG